MANLPEEERRSIFRSYLVEDAPILIQQPIAWTNQESIDSFLLLKKEVGDDDSGQRLLEEARRVFYEENSFIIFWNSLDRFLDDLLGRWPDAIPVKSLVRKITIRIERHECGCGNLVEYLQHARCLAESSTLESVTFEWWDSWRHRKATNAKGESDDNDANSGDDSGGESDDTLTKSLSIDGIWSSDEEEASVSPQC